MSLPVFNRRTTHRFRTLAFFGVVGAAIVAIGSAALAGGKEGTPTLNTTLDDFKQPGTQPLGAGVPFDFKPIASASTCVNCHADYGSIDPMLMVEPHGTWKASMMAQSARDPVFWAAVTIANQDAANGGEFCIRCHAPNAYLSGRSVPTDGSAFEEVDFEGINCNFCHRLVDPDFVSGISPPEDEPLIAAFTNAGLYPPQPSNSRYIIDPADVRRGPYDDVPENIHPPIYGTDTPAILASHVHTSANLCWNCHDVSNPLMSKDPQGKYILNNLGEPHPTNDQAHMLPLHRTYSEWENSYYSTIGVQHNGRFGGNHLFNPEFIANGTAGIMKDCQDCHMPDQQGYGCNYEDIPPFFQRDDVGQHSFMGPNTWVINAIRTVDADNNSEPDFPDWITGLNDDDVNAAISRNVDFMTKASDMQLIQQGDSLRVRILNRTGHKLPTGFPDGRRMWINVKFLGCNDVIVQERGAYDFETAALSTEDTKVYEMHLGIEGADYAQSIGHPEGHSFHFVLANAILKDNRIPPAGFSNIVAQQTQSAPVGATYGNGQHWDDTLFPVPAGAKQALVVVYYQLTSREFIEFLRDSNTTDNRGQVAYDLWVQHGMSAPVVMDADLITVYEAADINRDGAVNVNDLLAVIGAWGNCQSPPAQCPADVDKNGVVNVDDLLLVIANWGSC